MQGFNNADKNVVTALVRMRSPEMQHLIQFFKNMALETDVALRRARPEDIGRLQGRAQLLEEFLTAVETSAAVLEKMR